MSLLVVCLFVFFVPRRSLSADYNHSLTHAWKWLRWMEKVNSLAMKTCSRRKYSFVSMDVFLVSTEQMASMLLMKGCWELACLPVKCERLPRSFLLVNNLSYWPTWFAFTGPGGAQDVVIIWHCTRFARAGWSFLSKASPRQSLIYNKLKVC